MHFLSLLAVCWPQARNDKTCLQSAPIPSLLKNLNLSVLWGQSRECHFQLMCLTITGLVVLFNAGLETTLLNFSRTNRFLIVLRRLGTVGYTVFTRGQPVTARSGTV